MREGKRTEIKKIINKKKRMGGGAAIKVMENKIREDTINTIGFCLHFMVIAQFAGFIRAALLGNS